MVSTNLLKGIDTDMLISDLKVLISHKDNWKILKSVHNEMESVLHYKHILEEKCSDMHLDKKVLRKDSRPFNFLLEQLILNVVSLDSIKKDLKLSSVEHIDEFLEFMKQVLDEYKPLLKKFSMNLKLFEQDDYNILKDFHSTFCKLRFEDNNASCVLLRIRNNTYKCMIKDIEILIKQLQDTIKV